MDLQLAEIRAKHKSCSCYDYQFTPGASVVLFVTIS